MIHPKTRNSNFCYSLDVETNGKEFLSSIISLSMTQWDYNTGKELDHVELNFRPENEWNRESESIHGISRDRAMGFQDARKGFQGLVSWLDKHYRVDERSAIVCHALDLGGYFDWYQLLGMFLNYSDQFLFYKFFSHTESTVTFLQQAVRDRKLDPIKKIDKSGKLRATYKLNYWASKFNIKLNHHDARSDEQACAKIYWKLRDL